MKHDKKSTMDLARSYADRGEPNGWFEEFYARAEGKVEDIFWADLKVNPLLADWLRGHPPRTGATAAVIGCGLGDDAEALAVAGCRVTAFDVSASAIGMCRERFPAGAVDYRVEDLFALPADWRGAYDLVYECNTIQILVGDDRLRALAAMVALLSPGGRILVSCRSRESGQEEDAFPLALDRVEIDGFVRAGLVEESFLAYDDDQDPPVPHYFAVYRRPRI